MSTEREELAKDIDGALYSDSYYGDMFRVGHSRETLIDAILAAGYSKASGYSRKELAAAWASGYWHGTSHDGPLNDAAVAALNPYTDAA